MDCPPNVPAHPDRVSRAQGKVIQWRHITRLSSQRRQIRVCIRTAGGSAGQARGFDAPPNRRYRGLAYAVCCLVLAAAKEAPLPDPNPATDQSGPRLPALRASDQERDKVVEMLSEHAGGDAEQGSRRPPRPGAPVVRVRSYALLGGYTVWRLPPDLRGLPYRQARRAARDLPSGTGQLASGQGELASGPGGVMSDPPEIGRQDG